MPKPLYYMHEFEFVFRLVKNVISKKVVDDIMSLYTIKSNLSNRHFRSANTISKKIDRVDLDDIGKYWIRPTINYNARGSVTPYYWRNPLRVVKDLLQNPSH